MVAQPSPRPPMELGCGICSWVGGALLLAAGGWEMILDPVRPQGQGHTTVSLHPGREAAGGHRMKLPSSRHRGDPSQPFVLRV